MTTGDPTFVLGECIAEGPTVAVYHAEDEEGRPVVVRVVTEADPRHGASGELPVELERQARTAHPGLAGLVAHGNFRAGPPDWLEGVGVEEGSWFAHPFATGGVVGRDVVPASWPAIESVLVQLLGTLSHLHARQWTHGAVTDGCVLYFPDRQPWIKLDAFRGVGPGERGTFETPPEAEASRRAALGPWSDLYSVGRFAERLVRGGSELDGERVDATSGGEVPEGVLRWVERMTAENPWHRPRSAARAIGELAALDAREAGGAEVSLRVSESSEIASDEVTEPAVRPGVFEGVEGYVRSGGPSSPSPELGSVMESRLERERDWAERACRRASGEVAASVEVPPVGREEALRRLAEAFEGVVRDESTEVVRVEGPVGAGGSLLVNWFGRTVREMGLARFSSTIHSRFGGRHEGVDGLFRRIFLGELAGFDDGAPSIGKRIRTRATRTGEVEAEVLDLDVRAALHLVGRKPSDFDYRFSSRQEKFAVAARLLDYLSEDRPFVLAFDEVRYSRESSEFVEYLADEATAPPVLVLTTAHGEGRRNRVDDVACSPDTTVCLEAIGDGRVEEFFGDLSGEGREIAEAFGDGASAPPLVLREWVRDRQLGGEVDSASVDASPSDSDLKRIWLHRFERLGPGGRGAVEVASVLGRSVDGEEWRAACRRAGIEIPTHLVARLVRLGVAHRESHGWRFAHPTVRRASRSCARRAGRLAEIADAASTVVESTSTDGHDGDLRRARLLELAERRSEEADALITAIDGAMTVGALEGLEALFDRHGRTTERLEGEERREHRIRHELSRVQLAVERSDFDEAGSRLDALFPELRQGSPSESLVKAILLSAALLERRGHLRAALRRTDEAMRIADEIGETASKGLAVKKRGSVKLWQAEWAEAIEAFRRASELFGETGCEREVLKTQRWLMVPYTYCGELEIVERAAESLRQRALEAGDRWTAAQTTNQLGEVARYRGNWAEARRQYRAFRRASERLGLYNERVGRINLGLVDVGAGDFRRARRRFDELVDLCGDDAFGQIEPTVRLGHAAALAGVGDEEGFRRAVERAGRALDRGESRKYDQFWIAERIEEIGARRGWSDDWVGSGFPLVVGGLREYFE